jgi:acetolactate synthase I/II/III large subunit
VLFAGRGVLLSGAAEDLRKFVERTNTPVASTLLGLGSIPSTHPLSLGMMGMHGEAYCNLAIQDSDLIIAVGMRFDDRVTGNLKTYAPHAKKIHVDTDPTEINKIVRVDLSLLGDAKAILEDLAPLVEDVRHDEWLNQIAEWRKESDDRNILTQPHDGKLYVPQVLDEICKATKGQAIVVTDVGQHQMWTAQYYGVENPNSLITSGGAGSMGFGLPAGIGAKMACPDREVWIIVGDGGFQMTQAELSTAIQEGVQIRVAIMNNNFLGMVRQWQEFFFEKRYSAVQLKNPDFVKIAEAHGIAARKVERPQDVAKAIEFARGVKGPVVLEFKVEMEEAVYPMVPTGGDLHVMIRRPIPEKGK